AAPEHLISRFDFVKEVVSSCDVTPIGFVGFESDDCMGTLASLLEKEQEVVIVAGAHDMLQHIEEQVHVAIMKKGIGNYQLYTLQTLFEEKGLTPAQVIDVKGLMGDTADNYPGVKGIGEKTAYKLIQQFASIEGLL